VSDLASHARAWRCKESGVRDPIGGGALLCPTCGLGPCAYGPGQGADPADQKTVELARLRTMLRETRYELEAAMAAEDSARQAIERYRTLARQLEQEIAEKEPKGGA
jgi:hypothetical protein